MTKDYTYGDIREAKYMDLAIIPVSDVSSQFCNYVIKLIEQIENRKRARRAKDQSSFEYASKLILGDLLIARTKDNAGWLFRSVSKKNFYHSEIKGDTFNLKCNFRSGISCPKLVHNLSKSSVALNREA